MLSKEEVKYLADLTKIHFSVEELDKVTAELSEILEILSKIKEVDTEGVEPTYSISGKVQPLREDVVKPSLPKEEVLKIAPEEQYGYFKLPRIID